MSPKKQIEQGLSVVNVKCNAGLILMKKLVDNSAACVRKQTAVALVKRGWGEMVNPNYSEFHNNSKQFVGSIAIENTAYSMNYRITGAKITKVAI